MNPADDGRITTNAKDDSYTKEKILEKQKRLSDHKDLLKEKLKFINETVKRSSLSSNTIMKKNNAIGATNFPGILNQKKPSALKNAGNVNNANINITKPTVMKTQTGNTSGTSSPKRNLSPTKKQHQENQPTKPETKVRSPVFTNKLKSPKRQSTSPEPSKLEKVDKPKENETKTKPAKVIKVVKKKKKKPVENSENNNKYFQREFMETYTDKVGYQSFKLPKDEYQDLMSLKQPNEEEEIYVKRKMKKKCFLHVCPDIETKEEDGSITNCFIDSKLLVLAQTEKILAFSRKGNSAKDWILKDSMSRLTHDDVIKEMIIKCYLDNVKETTVLCEVYLLRNKNDPKIFMKMAQYRFLSENGKLLKEYLLGSFDCELENFTCCSIGRRHCCVAVCAWSRSKGKSIAWVFTHCIDDDTMKCTPMIPLKHEVTSLHDLSVSNNKLVLLAFGKNCFTVWSAKTGERFTFIDLKKVLPVKSLTCHFGVFAIIQRGFLFIMTSAENHLYMIAVNLASRNSKPLRRYRLPRGQQCLGAAVKEDKLIAISKESVVCWDLQTSEKLQHLKTDGATPFLVKNKVLLMDENRFSRLLTVKSEMDKHLNKISTDTIPTMASVQSSRTSIATSTDDL